MRPDNDNSARRLSADDEYEQEPKAAVFTAVRLTPVPELPLGGTLTAFVESTAAVDHALFRLSSSCDGDAFVTLEDLPIPAGTSEVKLRVPWHVLLLGNTCETYWLDVMQPHQKHNYARSAPLSVKAYTSCPTSGMVLAPADGAIIDPTSPFTFSWDPAQLFFFNGSSPSGSGEVVSSKRVALTLVGRLPSLLNATGLPGDKWTLEETLITPSEGVPNGGAFAFDFASGVDGQGNILPWAWADRYDHITLRVTDFNHSRISGDIHNK